MLLFSTTLEINETIEVYFPNPNVENKKYLYKRLKGRR